MTEHQVDGRAWDDFDAYLFDIDGTLLNCADAVHYFAFCDALQSVSGRSLTLEGVVAHGNTDMGILRDALRLADIDDNQWRPRIPEMQREMGRFVVEHEADLRATALPYVKEVLEHLQRKGAVLGIATGNLREIGVLKLKRAGLLYYFTVGGWSDDYETRSDVFRHALKLIRGASKEAASICVVGDTPADVLAAHANGLPVIAVATGVYSRKQLLKTQPELCLGSLEELGFACLSDCLDG